MLSVELIKNLNDSLNSNIINICYSKNGLIYNKFYTRNRNFIEKNIDIPENQPENSVTGWDFISESWDIIDYDSIRSFGYPIDPESALYSDLIDKNKNLLLELKATNNIQILDNITDYVNTTCDQSVTIKDVIVCLKTIELLNITLSDKQISNFLQNTIGLSLINKVLILFLDISDISELNTPSNLELFKQKYINLINQKVEKEKIVIEEEFNKLKIEFDELNSDEVNCMKDNLDTIKNDYSIFDNKTDIIDMVFTSWPSILAPNPFQMVYG
jgi:hypothetical protein